MRRARVDPERRGRLTVRRAAALLRLFFAGLFFAGLFFAGLFFAGLFFVVARDAAALRARAGWRRGLAFRTRCGRAGSGSAVGWAGFSQPGAPCP